MIGMWSTGEVSRIATATIIIGIAAVLILKPANSSAANAGGGGGDCKSLSQQVSKAIDEARAEQTGGMNQPDNFVSAKQTAARDAIAQVKAAGCRLSPEFSPKHMSAGAGTIINTDPVPAAPGEQTAVPDPTYQKDYKMPFANMLPQTQPSNQGGTATGTPNPTPVPVTGHCGQKAAAFANNLKTLTGANKPRYKEGCAGKGNNGSPQTSPDRPGASCSGIEFSRFGLIQGVYNNSEQSIDMTSLYNRTPGSAAGTDVIISRNARTGASLEPGGCRLGNFAFCGRVGDIIMVQSSASATDSSRYDRFLVYDGSGSFYEVNDNFAVINHGPVNPSYTSMTYAVVRDSCAQ